MSATSSVTFHTGFARHRAALLGTARRYAKGMNAYLIDVIRIPVWPLLLFATTRVTYSVAHRETVDGVGVSSFLLIGMVGMITWSSTIWSSGYALETERYEGTSAALFLSPVSRVGVIAGYGLGSFLWLLPSFLVVIILGVATGARLTIGSPIAFAAALLMLFAASLATGFAFASLFVLSRRANVMANFLQAPIYLLAGFQIARASLPGWLHPLSDAIPASHATDALRASALHGASFRAVEPTLLATGGVSAVYLIIGLLSLRRVEYAARRSGHLDLY
jgi:ABC-type multidrug transport system permease subunit